MVNVINGTLLFFFYTDLKGKSHDLCQEIHAAGLEWCSWVVYLGYVAVLKSIGSWMYYLNSEKNDRHGLVLLDMCVNNSKFSGLKAT